MKSVFFRWRKPEYPEETTDLRQVTDETFHTYSLCPVQGSYQLMSHSGETTFLQPWQHVCDATIHNPSLWRSFVTSLSPSLPHTTRALFCFSPVAIISPSYPWEPCSTRAVNKQGKNGWTIHSDFDNPQHQPCLWAYNPRFTIRYNL